MASPKAQELASIRPRISYLGDYKLNDNKTLGPIGLVRAFSPNSVVKSRDGTIYSVATSGAFISHEMKTDYRNLRAARRANRRYNADGTRMTRKQREHADFLAPQNR